MRSHSVSAEGGISGVLYPGEADDTADLHAFDTVKGGDYLGDQPAIETLVAEAPEGDPVPGSPGHAVEP